MENLSAFLKSNKKKKEHLFLAVSDSFADEKGKTIKWEIRPLSAKRDEGIRETCTKMVPIAGKKAVKAPELDVDAYLGKLVTASVVYPNLNDKELQDSYGVMCAEELIKEMLSPGEYQNLTSEIQKLDGFNITFDDKVEEAKN
ncbi:MAG: hypothetical protein LKJ25_04315 [Clostridia bacterium]|jgi:hypothetical protein|nr:hypothetical protein [Clostridia bacterium]